MFKVTPREKNYASITLIYTVIGNAVPCTVVYSTGSPSLNLNKHRKGEFYGSRWRVCSISKSMTVQFFLVAFIFFFSLFSPPFLTLPLSLSPSSPLSPIHNIPAVKCNR